MKSTLDSSDTPFNDCQPHRLTSFSMPSDYAVPGRFVCRPCRGGPNLSSAQKMLGMPGADADDRAGRGKIDPGSRQDGDTAISSGFAATADQGISVDISGASDELTQIRAARADNYEVAIVLSFPVMVTIFHHWGWPRVILNAVPLGIAGGIAGLAALNGVGVVVNNTILIVDRALADLRSGMDDVVKAVRGVVLSGPLFATLVAPMFLPALVVTVVKMTRSRAQASGRSVPV